MVNLILRSIPQHKRQMHILLRPAHDNLFHERCEQRRIELQALLLLGQHAHEQRYPLRPVLSVIQLTEETRSAKTQKTGAVKKAPKRKKDLAEQSLAESFFSGIIKLQ